MNRALIALLALNVCAQAAPSPESARNAGEAAFFKDAPLLLSPREMARTSLIHDPILRNPRLSPFQSTALGAQVGKANLAELLNRHRDLLPRQLGAATWNISIAGDASFKNAFLTFAKGAELAIAPMGDVNRLRGEGVNAAIAPGVVYNFKVAINIFNPVRASTLKITPTNGTSGPKHELPTGKVVDGLKAKSYVFSSEGVEYWLLYGTDVDPKTNKLAATKSLLFAHEDGTSSKIWPVAEASLEPGKTYSVTLDQKKLILTKTAAGELIIQRP